MHLWGQQHVSDSKQYRMPYGQSRRKGTWFSPELAGPSGLLGLTWSLVHQNREVCYVCLVSAVSFLFYEVRQCLSVSSLTYCDCCPCRVFGFIARKQGSATDNVCHLFAEHDPEQPASAIVNFVSKVMIGSQKKIWCLSILDSELFADFTEGNHCERAKGYLATTSEYCHCQ